MSRRDPHAARVLGLWTAGWLAVFLVAGTVWLGEPSVQWPVLVVPLLWALVALRPRRHRPADDVTDDDRGWDDGWDDDVADDRWDDGWDDDADGRYPHSGPAPAERTDTVERPALRRASEDDTYRRRRD